MARAVQALSGMAWYSGQRVPAPVGRESRRMPPLAPASFADLLRQHRLASGLTQEALAERAGLSVNGIQKLERGPGHPYRDTVLRLVAALRLSPEDQVAFRGAA